MTPATTQDARTARTIPDALLALLDQWVERGWLRALDRAFVDFLHREVPDAPAPLLLAAALASHQLGRGHVCLELAHTLDAPDLALSLPPEGDDGGDAPPLPSQVLDGLTLAEWQAALNHPELVASGPGNTPLVAIDHANGTRLYLRRYWQYEQDIRERIAIRLSDSDESCRSGLSRDRATKRPSGNATEGTTPPCGSGFSRDGAARRPADTTDLATILATLFPASSHTPYDWQQTACALAARSRFAIITGGPGTGKTTTVVKLLALLQTLALSESERPLRIRLAAPTGKAAARLNASIAGQVEGLSLAGLNDAPETLRRQIPTEVTTLHRLLGSRPDTRHFRHHAGNPLPLDVLVIDEASMVDVEMMAAVLTALPGRARLILLGDKDQLASVEAGSVLGDLCARADGGHYTPDTADWLQAATGQTPPADVIDPDGRPLDQAIAMLRVSHRFDADSGIGQLAGAVNADRPDSEKRRSVQQILDHGYADLAHLRLHTAKHGNGPDSDLDTLVVNGNPQGFPHAGQDRTLKGRPLPPPTGYRHYLDTLRDQRPPQAAPQDAFDRWAQAVLDAHGSFQLLCALRRGPWGVEGLNERIRQALERHGLIDSMEGKRLWYLGRPVLVTRNDYGLGLMNGDIGITLALPHPHEPERNVLRVAFPTGDQSKPIKWVLPSRLQAVETVYAMTVHKSQGSEFTHTALLLPDAPNPILTRELIYTGITRARHWLTLVESGRGILQDAVQRNVVRVSGLGRLQ
ncbi:exodeoxyribonuclease V subunit alpha [Aidingimonas halophila]|uniref:RecBCD enzyme subunit RecD n=1 Tax=Aidingimonas halophila TaxID=574349 RepID=A0A1H2SWY4_9GAMM|nr:exodeoxyribonuclease V subunit alpha [Aidingimonas halophila]GHC17072.1 RecBCD enzyme subunit RecD [Aidingimonas halophila]SDW35524.1 DNA helicase/exodeoxyribonuclease V, alpha subunit [Aidingimonas halophila]